MLRLRPFRIVPRLAGATLALASAAAIAAPDFIDLRRVEPVGGDANAGKDKAAVCSGCHGAAGVAPVPLFPNLAGQREDYLYWQLVEFKREARPESPMTSQVANLDDAAMRDLAAYFASLPPGTPAASPSTDERGAALYRHGNPATGTPPCQGCHGADGSGHPLAAEDARYRVYPVLRGQHADYLAQRLKDLRVGKHTTSSSDRIMAPIAATLDDDAIASLAHWLESGAR